MPSKLIKITVLALQEEIEDLDEQLKLSGDSRSNHFRKLQGWAPREPVPAPKGNQRAVGNAGRWKNKKD